MGASCGYQIYERLLKNGATNQKAIASVLIHAHIQLAGDDLTNNHTLSSFPACFCRHLQQNYNTEKASCQSEIDVHFFFENQMRSLQNGT